jgi:hypothetical protein
LSSGWSREQNPYRPPFQHDLGRIAREEDSNPLRLGRRHTRGSTEARDHFIISSRGRADHRHPSSKWNHAGATPAGSRSPQRTECAARLLSGVSLVRCQGGEPFHKPSASALRRRDSPWRSASFLRPHGAIVARLVFNQKTSEHYRVRVPLLHVAR